MWLCTVRVGFCTCVSEQVIACNTVSGQVIACNTVSEQVIACNTVSEHVIACNTVSGQVIACNIEFSNGHLWLMCTCYYTNGLPSLQLSFSPVPE